MMMKRLNKIYLIGFVVCFILALIPFETEINAQLNLMLTVTLATYAVARGLNAVVSMAQGTELSVEPFGVGVTLAPGELLDPLNDLIEQVSMVLLIASSSIGMQKILMMMVDANTVRISLIALIVISLLLLLFKVGTDKFKQRLLLGILMLTLLRCMIPIMTISAQAIQTAMTEQRQQAVAVLQQTQQQVKQLNQSQNDSKSWYQDMKSALAIKAKLEHVKQQSEQAVQASIYVLSEFVLVFVMLPIMILWITMLLIRLLCRRLF